MRYNGGITAELNLPGGGPKMPRVVSSGDCALCGKSYRKSGMTRHLQTCLARNGLPEKPGKPHVASIHLFVEDDYRPEYWMHLAAPATTELAEIDQYLRDVWLECCWHLSSFFVGSTEYKWKIFEMDEFFADFRGREIRPMEVGLAAVAPPRTQFGYWYDYGTTSELTLRSMAEIAGPDGEITLLARNDAPATDCSICGAPATWVGPSEYDWIAMTAGLCDACAPTSEYRLPIVNSPRSGVCAYDGEPIWVAVDDDGDSDSD